MFGRRRGRHARGRSDASWSPLSVDELGERSAEPDAELDVALDLEPDLPPSPTGLVEPPHAGPYDAGDAPADGLARLDLGSLRLPVPPGAKLQVEVDQSGPVRAVHLLTPNGQLTVNAFAAPRTGGLWKEVRREIFEQLVADGARVSDHSGGWGFEVLAVGRQHVLRFVGVDGPRWLLRGVAAGTAERIDALAAELAGIIRDTVVVRGDAPMPVRAPLPLTLPEPMANQLKQAAAARTGQA